MIRRDDGGDWLIIEQIKHANLAADIARVWGNDRFEPLAPGPAQSVVRTRPLTEEREWIGAVVAFYQAVRHHDDGWSEWDWAPGIDPRTGKPRDFREMRMPDAVAIWSKSIASPSKYLPLAAYGISRHFCFLAELVRDAGRHDPDDVAAVCRFLDEQSELHVQLEQGAARLGFGEEFHRYRELAFRTVQFFDRVSLWLCCAEEQQPASMTAPMGEAVTFGPHERIVLSEGNRTSADVYRLPTTKLGVCRWRVTIDPYPLRNDSHEFTVDARRIPARTYADDADLQTTWSASPTVELAWTLCRA